MKRTHIPSAVIIGIAIGSLLGGCVFTTHRDAGPPGLDEPPPTASPSPISASPAPVPYPSPRPKPPKATPTPKGVGGASPADEALRRGRKALHAGNTSEARKSFENAVKLDPASEPAWTYLAYLYEQSNEMEKARDALRRAKLATSSGR